MSLREDSLDARRVCLALLAAGMCAGVKTDMRTRARVSVWRENENMKRKEMSGGD